MDELIAELNAEASRLGADVRVTRDGGPCYRIVRVVDRFLITHVYDLVLRLSKAGTAPTAIDLEACRALSSVELTLIGYIITQVRFHGGSVRIRCPSPVNRRALAMVGFDRLAEVI